MAVASRAIEAARARQTIRAGQSEVRIEWMIKEVVGKINMTMDRRTRLATELVKSKIIKNISVAVLKETGPMGGTIVTQRSVRGEFPRADTVQLLKSLFSEVKITKNGSQGYVGTPLSYGLILELHRRRSFLVRTLNENRSRVKAILSSRIK